MTTRKLAALFVAALFVNANACSSAGVSQADSEEVKGAPEVTSEHAELKGTLTVGATLTATTGVNLRTAPSTSATILHVVPAGAKVTVVDGAPQNGFYKVKHSGTTGWSFGQYYSQDSNSGGGNTPSGSRGEAVTRAKEGVGFSYWWGHGRWRPEGVTASTAGSCSGSCGNCSHSGAYGADCSGYVAKIWQVGANNSDITVDNHPYSTGSFVNDTSQWSTISRGNMQAADALVYNSGSEGHIMLYSSGDGWGSLYAYECKGCSYGCVYNLRSASSAYKGIRRAGY